MLAYTRCKAMRNLGMPACIEMPVLSQRDRSRPHQIARPWCVSNLGSEKG